MSIGRVFEVVERINFCIMIVKWVLLGIYCILNIEECGLFVKEIKKLKKIEILI